MTNEERNALAERARHIRGHIIRMLASAGSGHPGGSLSAADLLAVLYFKRMRIDPKNPRWPDRDRFVLSKGHAAPVLYATLAEAGFFPTEQVVTLRQFGSILQGHPDMRKCPGCGNVHRLAGAGALRGQRHGPGRPSSTRRITVFMCCLAMGESRKARFGRLP